LEEVRIGQYSFLLLAAFYIVLLNFLSVTYITKIVSFSSQAAVEEGIVVGGGCTLLRLAAKVDAIKDTLENDEQKVKTKSVIH
jgi:hypothetical protein